MNAFFRKHKIDLGTDTKLLTNFVWLLTVYSVVVITAYIVARLLPPKTYGEYTFLMAVLVTMGIFTLPGANVALVQSVASGHGQSFVEAVRLRVRYSLVGTAILFVTAGFYWWSGKSDYAGYFVLLGAAIPFYHCYNSFNPYLTAHNRFDLHAMYQNSISVVSCVVIVTLILTRQGLPVLLFASVAVTGGMNFFYYHRVCRQFPPGDKRDPDLGRYAWQMTLNAAVPLIAAQVDRLLLFGMLGAEALASYSIAIAIPDQLTTWTDTFRTLLLPQLARAREQGDFALWRRRMMLPCIVGVVGAVLGVLFTPWLLHLLFAGKYDHAAMLGQLAFVGVATAIPQKVFQVYLEAQKAVNELHRLQVSGALVKIGLLMALVPRLEAWGAVMSLVAMRFALCGYGWWLVRGRIRFSKSDANTR